MKRKTVYNRILTAALVISVFAAQFCTLWVHPMQAEAASNKSHRETINVGTKKYFQPVKHSRDEGKKLTIKSSNNKVVKVSNNIKYDSEYNRYSGNWMLGKAVGKATVTITIGKNYTYQIFYTVEDPSISKKEVTLEVGEKTVLKVYGTASKITPKGMHWRTWDNLEDPVKVGPRGTVKGVKPGIAAVWIDINNEGFTCNVTVTDTSLVKAIKSGKVENLSDTNKKIAEKVLQVMSTELKSNMTDIEKVKAVHDYLVQNTVYTQNGGHNTCTYERLLLDGTGSSAGYAAVFQLFMDILDIPCKTVFGKEGKTVKDEHTWNMVQIEDQWYHVDTACDDPYYTEEIRYNYFMVTDDMMSPKHSWDTKKYPSCVSEEYLVK